MLTFFRRVSKSKIGTSIMALLVVAIMGGFALADISNFGSGTLGFGMSSGTLASVGDQTVTEREMSDAMQRRLQQARQENANADYASIMPDFGPILDDMIDERSLMAFADKYGFPLSKRMIDAEIAQIPSTKGLNGQFSEDAYRAFLAQQRLSDAQVREILAGGLARRLLLTPVAAAGHMPLGVATPYASMLLEERQGEAAVVPIDVFKAGLQPSDAQLQQFYTANRARYMIPEQRALRIARIGAEQVAGVVASDQEVLAYYNANKATYAPSDTRSLSQVVVPDQATANAIAERAKAGATLAVAAAPAGANAAVTTLSDQTRQAYAGVAGDQPAAAVFAAAKGAVVGPIHSDFGWVVVKVDAVKAVGGRTLEQAKSEIAAKLTADKRKAAIEDLVDKVQNALDGGANFTEAVGTAKLPVTTTPLITSSGASRADPSFKLAPELAPVLQSGFQIAQNDEPEIVSLSHNAGYGVVSPAEVVPAAPAPLAAIRAQVAADWINDQAIQRARTAATQIADKASAGMSVSDALKGLGVALPAPRPITARRIQIATAQGPVSPALRMLFTLPAGKSGMGAVPQGGGFFIVKVNKITPGNALIAPNLIAQVQGELGRAASQDYADEFLAAIKRQLKVKRNNSAIESFRTRLVTSGG
ncbi:MAG: peptidyl-prolyl cis-trans isomerase [Sphingomonadales bacterium]|nr:peptidyl-prolyl cis-trans isomerase [Sphingomonadales bacterium]